MKITSRDIMISTIGSLGSTLVIWILGIITSVIKEASVKDSKIFTEDGIDWSWSTIKTLLSIPVPMWIVLTLLSLVVLIFVFRWTLKNPPFLKEREMNIGGLLRRWEWEYDKESKKYLIYRLSTYCPVCGAVLTCSPNGYDCVNNHHYDTLDIAYTITIDAIVDALQEQYPKYRDFIDRHHTLYG